MLVFGSHWLSCEGYGEALWEFFRSDPGHTGVLLFFVHTCTVLFFSMERHPASASNLGFLLSFYCRRIFRIYPLSLVTIGLVLLFRVPTILTNTFYWPTTGELLANLTLTQNLFDKRSLLSPMWSLPLEVQMYIVLPFLFLGIRSVPKQQIQFALLTWVTALALRNSRLEVYLPILNHTIYFPCFLSGMVAYACYRSIRPRLPAWVLLPALALFSFSCPPRNPNQAYLCCLALSLLLPQLKDCGLKKLNQATATVAKYSYSLYLLNPFVMDYFYVLHPEFPHWLQRIGTLLGSILISWLGFHCVESPLMRVGAKLAGRLSDGHDLPEPSGSTGSPWTLQKDPRKWNWSQQLRLF